MTSSSEKTILAIDDNATNLKMIQEILKSEYKVFLCPSGERALVFLQTTRPDLILLDVEMPDMDGYEVLTRLKSNPDWAGIPVIFLTASQGHQHEEQALNLGAVDYILKPIAAGILNKRIRLHIELETYRRNLENLVEKKTEQLLKTQDAILDILANVTGLRDNETGGHIMRTTAYVQEIVDAIQKAGLPGYELSTQYGKNIVKSAKLHDIGKVAIPDSILLKPDRLTPREYDKIKTHTSLGALMIDNAMNNLGDDSAFLATAKELVIAHHECWDGSGYPNGLSGEAIPLSGRIMAIADVYDALISKRTYKSIFSHDNAMFIIRGESGTHFDKTLIDLCRDVFPRFEDIARTLTDEKFELNDLKAW